MSIMLMSKSLREKLGEDGAKSLANMLNHFVEQNKQLVIDLAEQRFESKLSREIGELREEIAEKHANTIKWMFIFWVGQIGVITGILLTVVK